EQIDRAHVGRQVASERPEVLALQRAAEDEAERRVIGVDTAARGGSVRRLRVVDPADAVQLTNQLEPVRDAGERAEPFRNRLVGYAGGAGSSGRGRGVLAVVAAGYQRFRGQGIVGRELDPVDPESARGDLRTSPFEDAELRRAVGVEAAVPV